jgi:hypothetical protein
MESARILMLIAVILALPAAALAQPDFSRGGRLTPTERIIGDFAPLGDLDAAMGARYRRVLAALTPEQQAALAEAQRNWLRRRDACGVDRACLITAYRERIAALEAAAERLDRDPVPVVTLTVRVQPDGTIERPRPDGSVDLFNPATGFRGTRFPDGSTTRLLFIDVQPVSPPDLPPDYAGWSESVSASVTSLVRNLLRPEEAETLASAAPDDFFRRLDYNLKVLAFITGR